MSCSDLGYRIGTYITDGFSNDENINFHVYEALMNEDIDNELQILCSFYILGDFSNENEAIDCFVKYIPDKILINSEEMVSNQETNIQIHECLRNE